MPPRVVSTARAATMPWKSSGRRLFAHEDDRLALRGARLGDVGIEDRDAARRTRDSPEARSPIGVARAPRIDHRMQQLVELRCVDALHRIVWSMSPSSTMSRAMRTAAAAVRLPVRVCSR